MMTPEQKLADQIANAVESHWFNPAVIGRMLANQPIYTLDKVMEMVAQIVRTQAQRADDESRNGRTSEGLFLAQELNKQIELLQHRYTFNTLKLPSRNSYQVKPKREESVAPRQRGWVEEDKNPFDQV